MLSVENLTFRYSRQGAPVLNGVNLALNQGEIGILLGKNGSGKTTCFKNILGILSPTGGSIRFDGENLLKMPRRERARRIAYVPQDIHFGALSVFDSILMGRVSYFGLKASHEDYLAAEKIMADMHLEAFAQRNVEELSGGERQKIAIARALYKEASMVILDEPASALDPLAEAEIYEKFNSLVEDKTAIYISHRMSSSVFCDRILIIDGGSVADYDTHENLMKKPDSLYYKLFMSQAENYKLEEN